MSDLITCKAVLAREAGYLYLAVNYAPDEYRLIVIPVRPMTTPRTQTPEWQYEILGTRLHIQPSLLCSHATPVFHTAYDWYCEFELCPPGIGGYEHFKALNPDYKGGM